VLILSTPVLLDDYDEDSEPEYDTKADYVSWRMQFTMGNRVKLSESAGEINS
jgi:hypothetical protein